MKNLDTIVKEIEEEMLLFLTDKVSNKWIEDKNGIVKMYIRKSHRTYELEMMKCFDIASIEIESEYRRKGLFKKFLRYANGTTHFLSSWLRA